MYIIENPMLDLSTYFIAVLNLTITMENEMMNCFCYEVNYQNYFTSKHVRHALKPFREFTN